MDLQAWKHFGRMALEAVLISGGLGVALGLAILVPEAAR